MLEKTGYVKVFGRHLSHAVEHPNLLRSPSGFPLGLFFFFDANNRGAFRAALESARKARWELSVTHHHNIALKIGIWNAATLACDDDFLPMATANLLPDAMVGVRFMARTA
jgi:hypothetical protein